MSDHFECTRTQVQYKYNERVVLSQHQLQKYHASIQQYKQLQDLCGSNTNKYHHLITLEHASKQQIDQLMVECNSIQSSMYCIQYIIFILALNKLTYTTYTEINSASDPIYTKQSSTEQSNLQLIKSTRNQLLQHYIHQKYVYNQ